MAKKKTSVLIKISRAAARKQKKLAAAAPRTSTKSTKKSTQKLTDPRAARRHSEHVRRILKLVDEHYASGGLKARIYYDITADVNCFCVDNPHFSLTAHHFTKRGDIVVASELRDDAV